MDIKGKIMVFPKEVGENKIKIFETSINRKEGDKYVDKMTLRVNFAKNFLPDAQKTSFKVGRCYEMEIEGFLTTRSYVTKNGEKRVEPVVQVIKAKCTGSKEITIKEKAPEEERLVVDGEELPF